MGSGVIVTLRYPLVLSCTRHAALCRALPFERERLLASLTDNRAGTWSLIGEVRDLTIWRFTTPSALNAGP